MPTITPQFDQRLKSMKFIAEIWLAHDIYWQTIWQRYSSYGLLRVGFQLFQMLPILVFTVDTKIVFIFLHPYLCYPDMLLFPHFATDKIQFRQLKQVMFEESAGVGAQCLTAFSVLDSHSSNVSLSLLDLVAQCLDHHCQ